MSRWIRNLVLYLSCAALASVSWGQSARTPQPLSINHTRSGVSQLWAGDIGARGPDLKLANPNNRGMIAAALVYGAARGDTFIPHGVPEEFVSCAAVDLTKHGAVTITEVDFGTPGVKLYAEVISAPRNPVTVPGVGQTRLADGLGIIVSSSSGHNEMRALYPLIFSLPANSAVPLQREAARTCICDALDLLEDANPNVSEDTFAEFPTVGVCPAFTPPPAP